MLDVEATVIAREVVEIRLRDHRTVVIEGAAGGAEKPDPCGDALDRRSRYPVE
jgi:hypothetical protein